MRRYFSLPVLSLLENVASCPKGVVDFYSSLLHSRPLATQAAEYGYVSRKRLWWICGPRGSPDTLRDVSLPKDLSLVWPRVGPGVLSYIGKKPIPSALLLSPGYCLINS